MQKYRAVIYEQHGPPADVLRVIEKETPNPQPHEALVQMLAAPINPVDLNVIEGKYPVRPPLPAVAGAEGIGEVLTVGKKVRDLANGARVLVPHEFGSWRECGAIAAEKLTEIPPGIPVEQAAMLNINPPTAWRMLHDFVALPPGDWVVQNAANSGVGRAVIQMAKALGLRSVNLVRREELLDELRAEGGDAVLLDGDETAREISEATNGAKIRLALNAVGGESAMRLANALAPGGTLVTYGAMGRQPLRIPNGLLIFKDLRWRGFWITEWYRTASGDDVRKMFAEIFPLVEKGIVRTKVERVYAIGDALEAVAHAEQNRRAGKILFRFNA